MLKRKLALVLIPVLLLGLFAGCKTEPEQPASLPTQTQTAAPAETQAPEPDWAALYTEAAAALEAAPDYTMTLEITEERTVGGDTVTETAKRTARFQAMDTEEPVIHVSERISCGVLNAGFEQTWADGRLCAKIKNAKYYSREKLEDFLETQLPAVLLHPENYGSITEADGVLRFTEPKEAESWAMPEDGELVEAAASAVLTDGALTAADYEISYEFGGSRLHAVYHAELSPSVDEDLTALVPENAKGYESLDSVQAALLLYRSRIALENAKIVSLETYANYYAAASAVVLVQTDVNRAYVTEDSPIYGEELQYVFVNLQDQSSDGGSYKARYRDGVLTEQENDGEEQSQTLSDYERRIEEETFASWVDDAKLNTFPSFGDLVDARLCDLGDYWLVEFSLTDEFSEKLENKLNEQIYGDFNTLPSHSTAYTTKTSEGFVAVEKYTWLPTALNLNYAGVYTIDGQPSPVQLTSNTSIRLYDPNTYEALTDEPLPDTEPAEKPTPVFYEVTGQDGEKMYLFGTIHVGDDRTAFLPQSIYDAFDSADALAVEFDDDAFTELLAEDETLKQQVAEAYAYTDGTAIKNHVDSELYEAAVYLMKAAGEYTNQTEQFRPFVWSQIIDNFYLSQGRRLTSSKGVDSRLMARAREQEKEILNVESGEFQLKMLADYSDEVQEMMLAQSVSSSRNDSLRGTYRLYDLWCRGDEAALRERVAAMSEEERAEIDEDELAIYDEYHQKMEVERNAAMTEKAEEYLGSGKTVFFAVGLAHLLGEGGLVDSLREAGYTVSLIQP